MGTRAGWLTLVLLAAGCGASTAPAGAPPAPTAQGPARPPAPFPTPSLPRKPGAFAPALTRTLPGSATGSELAEVGACAGCHQAIFAQWQSSAHAFASFSNPIYRASVERLRSDVGSGASQFCAGCHDPALLVDGAMSARIVADDPRAHAGVACLVCHSATRSSSDGNGSYTLGARAPKVPNPGDPKSVQAHRRAMRPALLDEAGLCGSCHRAFLSPATGNAWRLPGADDVSTWRRSLYGGSQTADLDPTLAESTCQGCHMRKVEVTLPEPAARRGRVASHAFTGAHSWLAAMRDDEARLGETEAMLDAAASLDIAALRTPGNTQYLPETVAFEPGRSMVVDVVVGNEGTGHRFPGGTRDIADTWLEAELLDAEGRPIASAGTNHERSGNDPGAHRLLSAPSDGSGSPLFAHETHLFRAGLFDTTIDPHGAELVRFSLPVLEHPADGSLSFVVRLKHRSRSLAMQRVACEASQTAEDQAFGNASRRYRGSTLDPCRAQPVLLLAEARLRLIPEQRLKEPKPPPRVAGNPAQRVAARLYRYGKGLLTSLQEHLDELRPVLAYALADPRSTPLERARFHWLGARLAARQGRLDEALAALERARLLVGDQPVFERTRGDAYASVWHWSDAARAYERAVRSSPGDPDAWARLAQARGSSGDALGAFAAAARGLAFEPRAEPLLRSQALGLRELGMFSVSVRERALEAYLENRAPPEGPKLRALCLESSAECAREQLPVHVHTLEPAVRR